MVRVAAGLASQAAVINAAATGPAPEQTAAHPLSQDSHQVHRPMLRSSIQQRRSTIYLDMAWADLPLRNLEKLLRLLEVYIATRW